MGTYNHNRKNEDTELRCKYFDDCDFIGSKELMKCGDDFDPQYGEQCKKRRKFIQRDTKGGLQSKVK